MKLIYSSVSTLFALSMACTAYGQSQSEQLPQSVQLAMFKPQTHVTNLPSKKLFKSEQDVHKINANMEKKFQRWLVQAKKRAASKGISAQILQQAFTGVHFDPKVIKRDRNQSEFTKTIWDYLDTAVSSARINNGKAAIKKHGQALQNIEAKYGVNKEIVAAIWGLESAYGGFRGNNNTIESLATLAFDSRRGAFFEEQLMAALRILEEGEVSAKNMRGSWAGAMGHTQFMPTSFLDYAVDYNRDGRRDIWSDNPVDALASTAVYLKEHGWNTGQPWGAEVKLPQGFDYKKANREIKMQPSQWAKLGVHGVHGPIGDFGLASVLLPAGYQGAAFMIFDNFEVLESYNTADAYVIGVGHLADRLRGGAGIQASWPRSDRALTFKERKELQRRLKRKGLYRDDIDARIGPNTVNAVRDFQGQVGLVQDGYASPGLLKRLRQ